MRLQEGIKSLLRCSDAWSWTVASSYQLTFGKTYSRCLRGAMVQGLKQRGNEMEVMNVENRAERSEDVEEEDRG